MIISAAQNSEPEVERFEYPKAKQDELIDYFKLTPAEWEAWNRERHGEDRSKWRPPLKILIVCDRLLTGFDAPVEQVMYLDKPLRDHNLLQAIARTNRPLPAMKKRTGVVVDYFGVFTNLEKALNFDENIREESLIDWDALRATVPGEVARCMELFEGITIADTRECLLAALRRLRDPEAAKNFEHNFRSLERLWEAVAPDPCLYPHRYQYNWLCGIYVAHRRRQRGSKDTYGELSAKTRQLIQENTTFVDIAEALPVFKIDKDYVTKLDELPSPADKAAALEAILTGELSEDDPSFVYRQLGERLQRIKERKDAGDEAAAQRLRELQEIATQLAATKQEPERLGLTQPGEYGLFTILRAHAPGADEAYVADCARRMVAHLRDEPASCAGLEQLDRRPDAGRAVAAGGVLESTVRATRLRPGCRGSAVPEAGGERTGKGRWGELTRMQASTQHRIRLGGRCVDYRLVRSKAARKLRVRVGPDGVEVVQPARAQRGGGVGVPRPPTSAGFSISSSARSGYAAFGAPLDATASARSSSVGSRPAFASRPRQSRSAGNVVRVVDGEIVVSRGPRLAHPCRAQPGALAPRQARRAIESHLSAITARLGQHPATRLRDGPAHQVGQLLVAQESLVQLATHPRAGLRAPVPRDARGGPPGYSGSLGEVLADGAEPVP